MIIKDTSFLRLLVKIKYQPDKLDGIATITGTAYVDSQQRKITAIPIHGRIAETARYGWSNMR